MEISSQGTGLALSRCTGDAGRFLSTHWAQHPHHHNSGSSTGFADLLSLSHVDSILSSTFPRLPAFRLVRHGKVLDRALYTRRAGLASETLNDVADPGRIFKEFQEGATIVLQGLQRYWPPLTEFCRDLELTFTHPVQANAYITPRQERGLGIHYDTHDVFVLQTAGSKSWDVHQCAMQFPLATQHGRRYGELEPATLSLQLRAGEALYVPRGFLHQAVSTDEISIHITIGVLCYTWSDLIQDIGTLAQEDARFREALPVGFAHHPSGCGSAAADRVGEFKSWLDTVDVEKLMERRGHRFWSSRAPILSGHLLQLSKLDAIDDQSLIRLRPGGSYYIYENAGELAIVLGDRELRMPARLQKVVEYMIRQGRFQVSELADFLDEEGRMTLIRRLVREGLFEAGHAAPADREFSQNA